MRKLLLTLLPALAFTINVGFSQSNETGRKLKMHSIHSIGMLNGSRGASLSLQSIFGASIQRSFAGIGVGIDYYKVRSVPLFLDLRHELGKGNRSVFLYGDLGYNFPWPTEENKKDFFNATNYNGGIYHDLGVGYKIGFRKRDALLLSMGYSFKKIVNNAGTDSCPLAGPCFDKIETYEYSLPRIVMNIGWRF